MNGIQDLITPGDLAAEIRLERSDHKGSFLLVEGASDSRLFKKFVDKDDCRITVCHGRDKVLAVVDILEKEGFAGFLAVADSDFGHMTKEEIQSENVCVTDRNDIECMIVASRSWDHILSEYGSEPKIETVIKEHGRQPRDLVFEQAAFIGALRLVSKKFDLRLKFRDMKYKFEANNSFTIDKKKTVEHVLGRSKDCKEITLKEIMGKTDSELGDISDYLVICSGHDICRILSRALKHQFGNHNGFELANGLTELGRALRLSYSWADFVRSQLYVCMIAWEARNSPFRIFPV